MPVDLIAVLTLALAAASDRQETALVTQVMGEGYSDLALWRRVESELNPLAGMPMSIALQRDPRRVMGLIDLSTLRGLKRVIPDDPMSRHAREQAYTAMMQMVRDANSGRAPTRAIVDAYSESWMGGLLTAMRMWPQMAIPVLRNGWDDISSGFDDAIRVATTAAEMTRNTADNADWMMLIEEMEHGRTVMHNYIFRGQLPAGAAPGQLPQYDDVPMLHGDRRRIPAGRRELAAPVPARIPERHEYVDISEEAIMAALRSFIGKSRWEDLPMHSGEDELEEHLSMTIGAPVRLLERGADFIYLEIDHPDEGPVDRWFMVDPELHDEG